ncbi:major facilitator superfamily domain-containing protein [Sordaria brevicollis]|uniref:Major facilitator superfamily domain-containing protein n=1 Tax=Sordaria brevicollis TaxID=83679 RepID=A0AAE0PK21_SORBR|nr:major facilitator superfamily domain-containing protein [Sordaria brevicollis]
MAPPDLKDDSDKEMGSGLRSGSTTDIEAIRVPGLGQGGRSESEDSDGIYPYENDDSHDEKDRANTNNAATGGGLSLVKTLSRVISRPESNFDPGPPPDGGARAWGTVAAAHLVIMTTWGFINSFGVFQTYYTSSLPSVSPSTISWIGSLQVFLLFFIGTFTGRLTDGGYFRHIFLLGTLFLALGIFSTANALDGVTPGQGGNDNDAIWKLFLSQGLAMGLGNGCLFCPCMATLSTYFSRNRSLAIGLAACGSATGGLVFPSMMRSLLPRVGFPWTVRAMGFICVSSLFGSFWVIKPRTKPRSIRGSPLVEWSAFREAEYAFFVAGSFLIFLGLYFAFYYLASFSRDIISLSYPSSLNILLVLNGVGVLGRIIPNYIADRVGPLNVFIPFALAGGICVLCWMGVTSESGLYVWAVFYGAAAGGIQSLFPAGLTSLTTDLRKAGVRMGMVFTCNSFATLGGPPVAGAIIERMDGRYEGAQAFAGVTLVVGVGFLGAARWVKAGRVVREGGKKEGGVWRVKV